MGSVITEITQELSNNYIGTSMVVNDGYNCGCNSGDQGKH